GTGDPPGPGTAREAEAGAACPRSSLGARAAAAVGSAGEVDSRTPRGEWKRFHPRLTPVGNCPPTSRHGCWRRRRPPFCRDCCGNLGPVQTQTPWGWETWDSPWRPLPSHPSGC
uniref:Uncharacterized protein n=1 Tax=Equus caballus TaxID=9796 RepID=A0A9L0RQ05_HORSE